MKRLPPPWVIEQIERLRRERAERERSRLELPEPPSPPHAPDDREGGAIVIQLRPGRGSTSDD